MAESLIIKDGLGAIKSLTVESSSYGLMPVHYVTSSTSAPVYITASSANPIPVTGNISVDVVVGDIINVTASSTNPVFVTGNVTSSIVLPVSYNVTTHTTNTFPVQLVGPNSYKATVDTAGRLFVTGAVTVNTGSLITVTASSAAPVFVTGSITVNTASSIVSVSNLPATQTVTASLASPVGVTGTVNINNPTLTVTSSILSPVVALAYAPSVTAVAASSKTSFNWTVENGTFNIASSSFSRRGLIVFNPGPHNLYVALSTAAFANNGFNIVNTASAPSQYSFIVYPSGTYTADETTVGVYHGGYFISGSASVGVFISAIS